MESAAASSILEQSRDSILAKIELRVLVYEGRKWGRKVFFSVPRLEIEMQSSQTFDLGDRYRLVGRIGGGFEFEIERTIRRDRHLDIYVPPRYQAEFRRGESYEVVIKSIRRVCNDNHNSLHSKSEEIEDVHQPTMPQIRLADQSGPAGHHLLTAQNPRDGVISFTLNKAWVEKHGRFAFERGKKYRITGSIGGVCKFSSTLQETGYSETHCIRVPLENRPLFEAGKKYDVWVEAITEIPVEQNHAGEADKFWEWKTVTAWTDTEGQYQGSKPPFKATISQDEKEPLGGIHQFLLREGIPSVVYDMGDGHYQLRTLGGMESLAKFILHTEPYVRTQNKLNQIKQFKEWLEKRSKHENVHKRNARRILGL